MRLTRRRALGGALGLIGMLAAPACTRAPVPPVAAAAAAAEAAVTPAPSRTTGAATAPSPSPTTRAATAPTAGKSTSAAPTPTLAARPATPTLVPARPTVTPTPQPPTATPVSRGLPTALEIPRIGVTAHILGLGTASNGALEAPESPDVVGWFVGGPKPGDPGNALLTGHLDWRTGVTGVFWRLRELTPGDEVFVTTEHDRLRFTVESTAVYDRDNAPVDQILGFQIGRVMTLLTCEGRFIAPERDYTHRRVVRARLAGV